MRKSKLPSLTLSEVYPAIFFSPVPVAGGIFFFYDALEDLPWASWEVDGRFLDRIYFANHSGDKLISPYLNGYYQSSHSTRLPEMTQRDIALELYSMFKEPWTRLFNDYDMEYNPLYNFSQTKDITETHNDSDSGTHTKGTSETRTVNLQDRRTADRDVDEQSDRSAYNSSTYQPVDKIHTDDIINNDTTQKTGTDTLAHTGADTESKSNTGGYHITESRSGFNGAYPYQDIIKKDRELWMDNYFEKIFKDIDSVLTLPIYPADVHSVFPWPIIGYPNV